MGKGSKIEWTHHTFSPWWGCEKVSPGCKNCYADALSHRWGFDVWGKDKPRRFFGDKHWNEPRKWDREAAKAGERRRVFCASMADVFEDRADLDEWRERLFALIGDTRNLDWLLLTKRPQNIFHLAEEGVDGLKENVWLGTTCENQEQANLRLPWLREYQDHTLFVSYEPALERVDFTKHLDGIDWLIAGAESGPKARPMQEEWIRDVRDQCNRAGVKFFYKQKIEGRKKVSLPILDGRQHAEVPR